MSTPEASGNGTENSYVMDAESTTEMARLIEQEEILRQSMGGPFVGSSTDELGSIFDVLDLACGPGGWTMAVAREYPEMEVTGVDISNTMLRYADAQAKSRELPNVHFRLMDALKPLDFPEHSFDLVHAQSIIGFVPTPDWPRLIQECRRVLKEGGWLNIVEGEWGFSNKPAFETLCALFNLAMHRANRGGSPTGRHLGISASLPRLFREAGFQNIKLHAAPVESSYGMPSHAGAYQDLLVMFQLAEPFLLKTKAVTKEEFDRLYPQVLEEMQSEDFCAIGYQLSLWGQK